MKDRAHTLSLTPETIKNEAIQLLSIIKYHESGTVISFQEDWIYRIPQLLTNTMLLKEVLGPYYKKYILVFIPLTTTALEEEVLNYLKQTSSARKIPITQSTLSDACSYLEKKGYDIALFISGIHILLHDPKTQQSLLRLEHMVRQHRNVSVVAFTPVDLAHEHYSHLVSQCSSLFTHLITNPLYTVADVKQFIAYNAALWRCKFDTSLVSKIYEECGGYLWLVRQVLRFARDNKNSSQLFSHDLLLKKVETLWNRLTPKQKIILDHIYTNRLSGIDRYSREFEYLKQSRLIVQQKNSYKLGIGLFASFITKEQQVSELQIHNNGIYLNQQDISAHFTKSELRLFMYLLAHKGTLVTREAIASEIWGENWEEKYTDWGLDRLVYRLRKKLRSLTIDEKLLKTLKSRGIMFG